MSQRISSIADFDYTLPPELIAQEPLADRQASRMLVVDRASGTLRDLEFSAFPSLLRAGDVLVLNNTKVFPARLVGRTETGARIELFLVRELERALWKTLAKPGRRLRVGKRMAFADKLAGEVVEKSLDGTFVVRFEQVEDFYSILDEIGRTPLPPYIKRAADAIDADRQRYQTVFAAERGAIAAPTAGLHFTTSILERIRDAGVMIAEITLHVGYGTFEPVRADELADHSVSPEQSKISPEAAALLNAAKNDNRRIVAVGTTTTRALETNIRKKGYFTEGPQIADLTITPGYRFAAVDALLTNFHLPQSSLLVLTSSFGSHDLIMRAYRHAVAEKYRFYSYGDCMLIY